MGPAEAGAIMAEPDRQPLFPPARWRQLRELLDRLDALDTTAREQELAQAATTDLALADAARALLDGGAEVDTRQAAIARLRDAHDATSLIGSNIGPFRLLRKLGEGGMGTVYLAVRRDVDFEQCVALKLLDGDATRMARIAARERRILASLRHPNITAFVDAGVHGDRAWLAMEFVDGSPLLDWCRAQALDVRARVTLFDQVCAAVAHAHAQLVVHRDLKPSNVLVGADGTVKLLDFGIALALETSGEQAPATRMFTPEYAAPEQLRGEAIGTATDIHALGLLLYELVSGTRLATLDHGREDWTTKELAQRAGTSTANQPAALPSATARLLRGDLGRIIAHALAPRPERRYGTVAQLRADLRRWLELRPLSIARPGLGYVAARFVRRNRALTAIICVALIALLATTAIALQQAHAARQAARRAEQAKNFLAGLLTDADPFSAKRSNQSKIELLVDAGKRLEKEMPDAPDDRVELRRIIASALMRLDEPAAARDLQQLSVDELRRAYGANAPQVGAALQLLAIATEHAGDIDTARAQAAQGYALLEHAGDRWARSRISALTAMAKLANRKDDYAQAQRWHEAAMRERIRMAGPQSPDVAMDLMNLAGDALYQERFADAEALALRARDMLTRTAGSDHARMIFIGNLLGLAYLYNGHFEAAEQTFTAALAQAERTLPPGTEIRTTLTSSLAYTRLLMGDSKGALALVAPLRQALVAEGREVSPALELTLGRAQLQAGQAGAAATLARAYASWTAARSRVATAPKFAAAARAAMGAALAREGDTAAGLAATRGARADLLASGNGDSVFMAQVDLYHADALAAAGDAAAARQARGQALALYQRKLGMTHPQTVELLNRLDAPLD